MTAALLFSLYKKHHCVSDSSQGLPRSSGSRTSRCDQSIPGSAEPSRKETPPTPALRIRPRQLNVWPFCFLSKYRCLFLGVARSYSAVSCPCRCCPTGPGITAPVSRWWGWWEWGREGDHGKHVAVVVSQRCLPLTALVQWTRKRQRC